MVKIAEGGIQAFARECPEKIIGTCSISSEDILRNKFLKVTSSLPDKKLFLDILKKQLEGLHMAIKSSTILLKNREILCNLRATRNILANEFDRKFLSTFKDQIPESAKCLACFGVFQGKIYQCTNGHCVCCDCVKIINRCFRCQVPMVIEIRNKALEHLLTTNISIKCLCGVEVMLGRAYEHARKCTELGARYKVFLWLESMQDFYVRKIPSMCNEFKKAKEEIVSVTCYHLKQIQYCYYNHLT